MPDICTKCGANKAKSPPQTCSKSGDGKHDWKWSTDQTPGSTPTPGGGKPPTTGKK